MPFEVAILIKSESQLEAVKAAEAAVRHVSAAASGAAAPAMRQMAEAGDKAHGSVRPLSSAVGLLAAEFGALGPVGNVAGNVLLQIASGIAGITLATAGATIGIAAAVGAIRDLNASKKQIDDAFDPKNLAATNKEIENLNEQIAEQGSLWSFVTSPLQTVGDLTAKMLSQESASEQKLAALRMGRVRAIELTVANLQAEAQARNAVALAEMAGRPDLAIEAQKGEAIRTTTRALVDMGIAGEKARAAIDAIGRGFDISKLKAQVESVKGVVYDTQLSFDNLLTPLGGAAGAGIQVALQGVTQTLNELTKYGAKFGFIDEAKLQQAARLVQGLGKLAAQEFGTEIPPEIAKSSQELQGLIDKLAQEYKIKFDMADFHLGVDEARAKVQSLRAEAERPIVFNVESGFWTQGSPRLPFSEYFQSYAPQVLKEFSEKAKADLTMDSGLSSFLGPAFERLLRLERMIARSGDPSLISGIHPGEAPGFDVERRRIMELIQWFATLFARSPQASASQGGGNINITIDARDLLSGLERTIRMTTGHTLNIRVLN
ncbi:MAG: hypothetical protein HYV04_07370 [Deltaproteobacteria bacterium]|nr:hypothetical protein [Deltaproteobacteria bacterium]